MDEQQAIMATLEDYARAYCDKDLDALMAVFAQGEDISLIGTGEDELCSGRQAVASVFRRNFAAASAHRFEWHWSHITVAGSAAVVAMTLTIHLSCQGRHLKVPVRWSVALKKEQQRWVWLHRHASSAAPGQAAGEAYPE